MSESKNLAAGMIVAAGSVAGALGSLLFSYSAAHAVTFQEVGPIQDSFGDFVPGRSDVAMDANGAQVVAWTSVGTEPFATFFTNDDVWLGS